MGVYFHNVQGKYSKRHKIQNHKRKNVLMQLHKNTKYLYGNRLKVNSIYFINRQLKTNNIIWMRFQILQNNFIIIYSLNSQNKNYLFPINR